MSKRWSKDVRPGDTVKAVSLWEPWASLMARGAKRIETRDWPTRYRGPLLICAAKRKVVWELEEDLAQPSFRRGLGLPERPTDRRREIEELPFGQALCLVDLYDCVPTEALERLGAIGDDRPFGNYAAGRYGWVTTGLRRVMPFPVTGRQGLFEVTLPGDMEDWP